MLGFRRVGAASAGDPDPQRARLARRLAAQLRRPVVDRTAVDAPHDIDLTFAFETATLAVRTPHR